MTKKRFALDISPTEYQAYYSGAAQVVIATTLDGLQIQFPASLLRSFVSHRGVHGLFEISYDANNKLEKLIRLQKP